MRKILFILVIIFVNVYSQRFESRLFIGGTLPIGSDVGLLAETDLPRINFLKVYTRASILWAPVFSKENTTKSVLIPGLQPGIRIKLINEVLLFSGGLTINPVIPLPFDGMDFGFGNFLGIGVRLNKIELCLHSTAIYGKGIYFSKIGWISLTISRAIFKDKTDKTPEKNKS